MNDDWLNDPERPDNADWDAILRHYAEKFRICWTNGDRAGYVRALRMAAGAATYAADTYERLERIGREHD